MLKCVGTCAGVGAQVCGHVCRSGCSSVWSCAGVSAQVCGHVCRSGCSSVWARVCRSGCSSVMGTAAAFVTYTYMYAYTIGYLLLCGLYRVYGNNTFFLMHNCRSGRDDIVQCQHHGPSIAHPIQYISPVIYGCQEDSQTQRWRLEEGMSCTC